jgi:SAM-dependent methyltransferase
MYKLNLGSGEDHLEGFINIDKYDPEADIMADITQLPYESGSCDELRAYQVFEHIAYNLEDQLFKECHRVLCVGGKLIVETPDFDVACQMVLDRGIDYTTTIMMFGEYHRPWDKDRYADWDFNAPSLHINSWDYRKFEEFAKKYGFSVRERTEDEQDPRYNPETTLSVELIKL